MQCVLITRSVQEEQSCAHLVKQARSLTQRELNVVLVSTLAGIIIVVDRVGAWTWYKIMREKIEVIQFTLFHFKYVIIVVFATNRWI